MVSEDKKYLDPKLCWLLGHVRAIHRTSLWDKYMVRKKREEQPDARQTLKAMSRSSEWACTSFDFLQKTKDTTKEETFINQYANF